MKKLLLTLFCAIGLLSAGASVTQEFKKGIGLPEGSAASPQTPTEYTATDTNIKYTLYRAYANADYLMLNGKDYDGAFISFALDFDCGTISLVTTNGCSENANNKVNFYVNDEKVQEGILVNVKNATINVTVPAQYQKAGNVYKIQYDKPSGTAYNSQFAKFVYYTPTETPETPVEPEPGETTVYTVKEAIAMITGGNIPSGKVQVKGLISEIEEISAQYGNATYNIKDQLTDADAIKVFRGKWLNNANFTGNEIAVGGTVVVEGSLVYYNNDTPEINSGNVVISYVAPAGGGNEGGDEPVVPGPGDAQTATFNFSAPATLTPAYSATTGSTADGSTGNTYETVSGVTFSEGAVTLTPTKGSTDARLYYQSGGAKQLRVYKGSTITIASTGTIEKVEFAFNNTSSAVSYNEIASSGKTFSYEVNTSNAVFEVTANSQINSITVTYVGGEEIKVAAPVISCTNNMVSIECVTADSEIYYTTDGTVPSKTSTKYDKPFAITANTVVKAIAYVDADASAVTTYNAVYEGTYAGFEKFVAAGAGTEGTVDGPLTAVYQNGSYLYVVDSNNYPMLVYGSVSATDLANGDKIANVKGKYAPYNGLPELTNPVLGEVTKGGSTAIEPEVLAAEEVATDMVNMYVEFTDMLIEAEGTNYTMSDETGSIALYNRFTGITMPTDLDATYTVRGFVSIYGTTIQIYPTEFIQSGVAIERVATPTFNPAAGAVVAGTKVAITSATEGATIFYTTDGTEPTIESTEYTGEIEITVATTIKAIAVKEGLNNSVVATAAYTILDPNATDATFDFTDEAWLTNEGVTLPADASTGQNIAGTDFTVNAITLTFPANEGSNVARIWRLTANSGGGVQLRVFAGDNFTFSASASYEIIGIEFECDATYQNFAPNTGTLTDEGVWTPAEKTTSVTFSPSKASRINTIKVTYKSTSGVNDVLNNDDNAPVEYYNLQGVRVAYPAAGNLYIVRQGNNVSKVIVR